MKKCPFCAEEIQDEAIKCKHCGEMLDSAMAPLVPIKPKMKPLASLFSFAGVWAMLYGASKWFGGSETQAAMTAGGAGNFSKPVTDHAMNSGLTYLGVGVGLLFFAVVIQNASTESTVSDQGPPIGNTTKAVCAVAVCAVLFMTYWMFGR